MADPHVEHRRGLGESLGLICLFVFGAAFAALAGFAQRRAGAVDEQAARQETPLVWLALVFPVVGVAILGAAFRAFLRWRKFGASSLELKTLPGVIGGWLEAVLQLSTQLDAPEGMALELQCIHQHTTGSGENRSTTERILWKREQTVHRGRFGLGRTHSWRAEELARIAVQRGSQYGNTLYWDIQLEIDRPSRTHEDGTPWPTAHAAGSRLPSESEARAFANAMAETLGIDPA